MKSILLIISLAIVVSLASCDVKKSNISPDASFSRVYESTNVDESYYPEDIMQLESGEYLVISTLIDSTLTNFPRISLTALAADGSVINSVIPNEFVKPVPQWLQIGGKQYFVCMDDGSQQTKIVEVTLNNGTLSYSEESALSSKLPLHSWTDGNNVLILSFDMLGSRSIITMYDANFDSISSTSKDASQAELVTGIYDHTHRYKDVHYPFFIDAMSSAGATSGYFVNCLTNSSLAMIFFDPVLSETGRVYGHHGNGIGSALCFEADTFSLSRFFDGDNFVFPHAGLDLNSVQNSENFQDIELSILEDNSAMDVILYELEGIEYIVYGATTSNNEVALLFFDAETGEQSHSRIIGEGNNIRVVQILETKDKGLVILGETELNGQFKRMIIMKLMADQLSPTE